MTEPTFTEDEGRRILARAAERQESVARAELDAGGSMSLADLISIAREVDIDVDHVRAAASELAIHRGASGPATTFGVPREIRLHRVIPGPVSDAQWERMVGVFRESFGADGVAGQHGDVREWTSSSADHMPVQVRLRSGEDDTLLLLRQSTHKHTVTTPRRSAVVALVGIVLFVLGLTGVTGQLGPGFGAFLAVAASLVGGGTLLAARSVVAEQRRRFEAVADRVELIGRDRT